MRTGNRVIFLIPFLILVAVFLRYALREGKIEAGLWHLWNGNTARFQEYDIPVPISWYADRIGRGGLMLKDVGIYQIRNDFNSSIIISRRKPEDKDLLHSLDEQFITSEGAQIFDRRTIEFDNEKADCLFSNSLNDRLRLTDKAISIMCESTAGLSFVFNGKKENIDTFYSIVSQIRKHND